MYITYDNIKECTHFGYWLMCDWNFVNKEGIREIGFRLFGIAFSNFSPKKSEKKNMDKLLQKQLERLQKV